MPKFDGRSHTITIHDDAGHGEPPPTTKIHASPEHDRQEYPSSRATEQLLSPPPSASASPPSCRHSDMSEVSSWLDPSEPSNPSSNPNQMQVAGAEPDLARCEATCPGAGHTTLVRSAGCWAGELTLAQPWRSHTLKGLSQDSIAYWTGSHEAQFQDGMYHSGFKFRVCMYSSLAFAVCLMALVNPCLTMLAVLTCLSQLLLLSTHIAAQRMGDKRSGRQLGQWSLILISIGFACSLVALAHYFLSAPTWNGGTCKVAADDDLGFIDPRHMFIINLGFGPFSILFGVMITLMTISTRGFVTILTGVVMPYGAAYFLSDNHS